jgi:hypothetical protein
VRSLPYTERTGDCRAVLIHSNFPTLAYGFVMEAGLKTRPGHVNAQWPSSPLWLPGECSPMHCKMATRQC